MFGWFLRRKSNQTGKPAIQIEEWHEILHTIPGSNYDEFFIMSLSDNKTRNILIHGRAAETHVKNLMKKGSVYICISETPIRHEYGIPMHRVIGNRTHVPLKKDATDEIKEQIENLKKEIHFTNNLLKENIEKVSLIEESEERLKKRIYSRFIDLQKSVDVIHMIHRKAASVLLYPFQVHADSNGVNCSDDENFSKWMGAIPDSLAE